MENMMAYCGLLCSDCNAYKATVSNDDELRKATAEEWGKMFSADIKPESINCLGCKSMEVRFSHCDVCQIRACGSEKKLGHCGECSQFGDCGMLEEILKHVPEARERLVKLKG